MWHGGRHGESEELASCYRNALRLADEHALRSIAFPAISTGAFGYPIEEATSIAVREARAFEKRRAEIRIVFCCFSKADAAIYRTALGST